VRMIVVLSCVLVVCSRLAPRVSSSEGA